MTTKKNTKKEKAAGRLKRLEFWTGLFRNFFTIIASAVSVVTLFILFQQNENTYRPDVMPDAGVGRFVIKYRGDLNACSDIQLLDGRDSIIHDLGLNLVNIGLGTAKSPQFEWIYKLEDLTDTVYFANNPVFTESRYFPEIKSLQIGNNCFSRQVAPQTINYVLPLGQEQHPAVLDIPNHYVMAWSNLLIRSAEQSAETAQTVNNLKGFVQLFHRLRLKATYRDINDKTYERRFDIWMMPVAVDRGQKKIFCQLNVTPVTRELSLLPASEIGLLMADTAKALLTVKVGG